MTKVSYFLLDELPMVDDLVVGGIYYLNDGSQFIVKSDKSLLEVGKVAEDEIKYDQSVRFDNLPSYFTAKKTVTSFSRASSGATGFLGHLENNYRLNNIEYSTNMIVSVETDRLRRGGGEESVVQTITLKYYSTLNDPWGEDVLQSVGKLVRVKVPGADRFRDMGLFPVSLYLKDMPASGLDGAYYGINGATIYISSTDSKYVCVSELQSGFSSKWKKITSPTVLDVTDAPTPPSGEDFVYSAESVKDMVDNHANLIASEETLGHVRIDGSTIVIDSDGVISSVSTTTNGEYTVDNTKTLVSPVSTFKDGKTVTYLPKSVANGIVNNELKWTLPTNSTHFDYVLETDKSGDIAYQSLLVYYNTSNLFQLMGKLRRSTGSNSSIGWTSKWNSDVVLLNYDVNMTIEPFGMYGMIRSVATTGKFYRNTNKTSPSQYGWVEMVNKASTTNLGSVKIDGTSIVIDADGVISSVGGTSEPVLLNYDIGLDLTVEELPQGYTLCYLSETNVAEEKDMWVQWIGELTYWAYPMENYTLSIYTTNNGNEVSQKVEIGMYHVDEDDNIHTGLMGTLYRTANIENGYSEPTITLSSIVGSEPIPENKIYAFKGVTYGSTSESVKFFKDSEYTDIISNIDWKELINSNTVMLDYNLGENVPMEELPLGYTVSYFSETNTSDEKVKWVKLIGDNSYWKYPLEKFILTVYTTNDGVNITQKVDITMHHIDEEGVIHTGLMGSLYRTATIPDGYDTPKLSLYPIIGKDPFPTDKYYAFRGAIYISPGSGKRFYKDDNTYTEVTNVRWKELNNYTVDDKTLKANTIGEISTVTAITFDNSMTESVKPSRFKDGINIHMIPINSGTSVDNPYRRALNGLLGSDYGDSAFHVTIETVKNVDGSASAQENVAVQEIIFRDRVKHQILAYMHRMCGADNEWMNYTCYLVDLIGQVNPEGMVYGILGSKYLDISTNKEYRKVTESTDGKVTNTGWIEISEGNSVKSINGELPDVNGNVELQIPEVTSDLTSQRTDVALSAFAGDALREMTYEVEQEIGNHRYDKASNEDLGHVKVDGITIVADENGVIRTTYDSSAPFRFRSIESVGLEVGDLREYEVTPDISMVIKRTIRNGHVSVSLKSTHGVELTGLDIQWRATTTYNLDDGVLGADEVKVIDTGVYVNNTEYPAFMIRYNDRMFRGDVMISGYLTTNKFFVFSEEL